MNRENLCRSIYWLLLAAALAVGHAAQAAATNAPIANSGTNNTSDAKLTNNPAPVEMPIPQSVFVFPKSPSEGIDPFYPGTLRFRTVVTSTATTTNKPPERAKLVINGFSTIGATSVIINGTTFAEGDERDVVTSQGRVRVRCVEIRIAGQMAIVESAGERRELWFRRGK